MKSPELLAPAGNLEKLKIAFAYGADAVYIGGKQFGLRAFSDNFDKDEIREGIEYAHNLNKKVYVAVNAFPHNEDLEGLPEYISFLSGAKADGIIVSDPGVYRIVRQSAPDLPIHISTQANNVNWSSVLFWEEMGAKRVVLAREMSIDDIKFTRTKVKLELEAFIHGAMCISYSGRCLLSNYFTGRDANRGECTQACRWKYHLVEETRPGQYFPVLEDERGTYIFNSKDLCMLSHIPELAAAGVTSFKIEGRMKSVHYVATVVKVYRSAIDCYRVNPEGYTPKQEWWEELRKISHRPYTTGFYFRKPTAEDQIYASSTYQQSHDFVGLVRSFDSKTQMALVEQRNNMKTGEEIEILLPEGDNYQQTITQMFNEEGEPIAVAPHPQQLVRIPMLRPVAEFSILRRRIQ